MDASWAAGSSLVGCACCWRLNPPCSSGRQSRMHGRVRSASDAHHSPVMYGHPDRIEVRVLDTKANKTVHPGRNLGSLARARNGGSKVGGLLLQEAPRMRGAHGGGRAEQERCRRSWGKVGAMLKLGWGWVGVGLRGVQGGGR